MQSLNTFFRILLFCALAAGAARLPAAPDPIADPAPATVITSPPPASPAAKPFASAFALPAEDELPAILKAPRPRDEPFFNTTTWPLWAADSWENTSDIVHDHLRIGLRYRQIKLTDDERSLDNSYLGSITELDSMSDYDPMTWLTFEWLLNPYFVFRFNLEQVKAQSQTTSWDNHTDGDVNLEGYQLSLLFRLPNRTRFVPTAGIGYAWLDSTFDHNPVWYNGFGGETKDADYAAWVAAGSPPWPNRGYRREIILDNTTALVLMGGLEIQLTDHIDLNLFVQHMEVQEVDVTYNLSFGGNVFESTQAEFPMSNIGYGAGIRWTF
jgi:opacity protein-like surface antigen